MTAIELAYMVADGVMLPAGCSSVIRDRAHDWVVERRRVDVAPARVSRR